MRSGAWTLTWENVAALIRAVIKSHTGGKMSNQTATSLDVVLDIIMKNSDLAALHFPTYEEKSPWGGVQDLKELDDTIFRHPQDEQSSSVLKDKIDHASLSRQCKELP